MTRYSETQLAAYGSFCSEVRSLLEVSIGLRAKRAMGDLPHTLRVFWLEGSTPAACAKAIREIRDGAPA